MTESIKYPCDHCQKILVIPSRLIGKRVRCNFCKNLLEILEKPGQFSEVAVEVENAVAPGVKQAIVSPKPKKINEEKVYADHRGGKILSLGIITLIVPILVGVMAVLTSNFSGSRSALTVFGFINLFCIFFLAPRTVFMGSRDIGQMKEGTMDPSGKVVTQVGRFMGLGAIFLCLAGVALLYFKPKEVELERPGQNYQVEKIATGKKNQTILDRVIDIERLKKNQDIRETETPVNPGSDNSFINTISHPQGYFSFPYDSRVWERETLPPPKPGDRIIADQLQHKKYDAVVICLYEEVKISSAEMKKFFKKDFVKMEPKVKFSKEEEVVLNGKKCFTLNYKTPNPDLEWHSFFYLGSKACVEIRFLAAQGDFLSAKKDFDKIFSQISFPKN
ncbi:MAG: hypothetical protein EXR99_15560 [Gemmataceae bacterium]|nr:hypothetical protein [Gemmataceae bacterium]